MIFKHYYLLKEEETLVDRVKNKIPEFEKTINSLLVKDPFNKKLPIIQAELKALQDAVAKNHAGDIVSRGKKVEDMLNPSISLTDKSSEDKELSLLKKAENSAKDVATEKDTMKRQIYEIGQLLSGEKNQSYEDLKNSSKTVLDNPAEIKLINDKLRVLRNDILKQQKEKRVGPKGPEQFKLGKVGNLAVDALEGKPKEVPKQKLSGIEKLASKIAAGIQKDKSVEPSTTSTVDVNRPSILEPTVKKQTNLDVQEKLMDNNKDSIPSELYALAKNAINKAKQTNDQEDITIAQDAINNALENA